MKDASASIVAVLLAIIGVAIVAVILSNGSNTVNVLTSSGNSFANMIKCAVSPITGGSCGNNSIESVTSTFTPITG